VSAAGPAPKIYSYDPAGNTTNDGAASFTYSSRGRLSSVQNSVGTTTFLINALGQRVKKQGPSLGGQPGDGTYYFLYDEQGRLLGHYGSSGIPYHEYVYLGDVPILDIVVANSQTNTTAPYPVITDQTGTPRMMINGTNGIVWRWDSPPFGDVSPVAPGTSTMWSHLRFPGQFYDPQTGLNYNYYRDYDPSTGRYIESDPIGLGGGINTYAYARVNPVGYKDPSGRIVVIVGPPEQQDALRFAYNLVRATRRGEELCRKLEDSPNYYFITPNTPAGHSAEWDRKDTIYLDPNYHPSVETTMGPQEAQTPAILGHELGHAAGAEDNGPGKMNNINQNENPIREELGYPARTRF
jgi:RHS repeat-associated protein